MTTRPNIFESNLDKNPANYAPLTPLGFIERAAAVYPKRTAVIHGARRYSWAETYARCRRLASVLAKRGIGVGDTVAAMLSNTPEMYECHFGVPMTGGVLLSLNTRLDADAIAFFPLEGTWLALFPVADLAADAGVEQDGAGFPRFSLAHNEPSPEDVDRVYAEALAAGARSVRAPHGTEWGGYSGYFADPDGFLWELAWNPFTDLT